MLHDRSRCSRSHDFSGKERLGHRLDFPTHVRLAKEPLGLGRKPAEIVRPRYAMPAEGRRHLERLRLVIVLRLSALGFLELNDLLSRSAA